MAGYKINIWNPRHLSAVARNTLKMKLRRQFHLPEHQEKYITYIFRNKFKKSSTKHKLWKLQNIVKEIKELNKWELPRAGGRAPSQWSGQMRSPRPSRGPTAASAEVDKLLRKFTRKRRASEKPNKKTRPKKNQVGRLTLPYVRTHHTAMGTEAEVLCRDRHVAVGPRTSRPSPLTGVPRRCHGRGQSPTIVLGRHPHAEE